MSDSWRRYFAGDLAALQEPGGRRAEAGGSEAQRTDDGTPQTAADEAAVEHRPPRGETTSATNTGSTEHVPLLGTAAVIAERMEESRELPTATSVRSIPAKLLEVNRRILNNQLQRLDQLGKVSFTHLIGWAVVRALQAHPAMNAAYQLIDGKPHQLRYGHVNLGIAIDMEGRDGSRTLLVPNIRAADTMDFRTFWETYEDIVGRARNRKITPDDFAGTTATLTNPGTVGTVQSVPRLMPGQGVIVGVGAIGYPPEYQAADPDTLSRV
ncbi:MAG TPA: 2-oxo acid dehydrogenase subunit E2, partial [Acidimicrobiia bacterium]|nr:2-oxo acid dehydrogenase subunit E2 [Acidimicrobiia bacterium]